MDVAGSYSRTILGILEGMQVKLYNMFIEK
jgi:hypothetical protein